MKPASILLLGVGLLLGACHKDGDGLTRVVITGEDLRACACCGGLMIHPDGDTTRYSANTLRVDSLPKSFYNGQPLKFPMWGRMSWVQDTTSFCSERIIITCAIPE